MRYPLFITLLLFTYVAPAAAQNYLPGDITNFSQKNAYLSRLATAHQEFRKKESDVLLQHGYDSAEHRKLQDSIHHRDALLLDGLLVYLDRYGFPERGMEEKNHLDSLQQNFNRKMQEIRSLELDSISLDSVMRTTVKRMNESARSSIYFRDHRATAMVILNGIGDFPTRCELVPFLLPVYEREQIPLVSMLYFLRHTYRIRHGQELDIPTGTTEAERLAMYRRELSGCE